jgi:4-amino-4-deoxy-L-arabinose transferase-like glycosyltransferase
LNRKIALQSGFLIEFILFLYATVVRLLFWTSFEDRTFLYSLFYYGDSFRLHEEAIQILDSGWNSRHLPYHPPITSYLLALIYQIFGRPPEHLTALKIVLILIASISVVIFYRLAKRFLSERLALIGAILFASAFPMLVIAVTPNTEIVFLCFAMLTLLFFTRLKSTEGKRSDAIWMGIFGAMASLTRAEFAIYFVVLTLGLLLLRPSFRASLSRGRAAVIVALAFLIPFIPWTIRNYSVLSEFNTKLSAPGMEPLSTVAPITCYGPLNFAMANNLLSDGKFSRAILTGANTASLNLNNAQHRHYFIHGYSEGFAFISTYTKSFLTLVLRKLELFMEGFSWGFSAKNFPSGLAGTRYPIDIFVADKRWVMWITIPVFAAGFVLSFRELSRWWPLHLLFLHRLAVTAAFFGYARGLAAIYFVVIFFMLYPLTRSERLMNRLTEIRQETVLMVSVLFFTVLAVLPLVYPVRFQASGSSEGGTGYLIQDAEMKIWPKNE